MQVAESPSKGKSIIDVKSIPIADPTRSMEYSHRNELLAGWSSCKVASLNSIPERNAMIPESINRKADQGMESFKACGRWGPNNIATSNGRKNKVICTARYFSFILFILLGLSQLPIDKPSI